MNVTSNPVPFWKLLLKVSMYSSPIFSMGMSVEPSANLGGLTLIMVTVTVAPPPPQPGHTLVRFAPGTPHTIHADIRGPQASVEDVKEILECDLKLEQQAMPELRESIAYCETVRDYISRELLEDILESEEEHVDFLETQFEMIDRMGLENYVQLQSEAAES